MNELDTKTIAGILGAGVAEQAPAAANRFADRADAEGLVEVAYASYDSPFGGGFLALTERGLLSVALPGRSEEDFLAEIAGGFSPRVLELARKTDPARRQLDEYFAGQRRGFGLDLDWRLIPDGFYRRVLGETAKLGYGVTATYGDVARAAGNARAYRAAGTALGRNPIPLVVPCHRVVRAGGVLGNYGGGPELKEALLRMEGALA